MPKQTNHIINQQYWENRYTNHTDTWDLQQTSPPLKAYINQLTNKALPILIPGCGHAHEAQYLYQQGFTNITIIDIAKPLINAIKAKFKNTTVNVLHQNIFNHNQQYHLILEQTLFCALHPTQRLQYIKKLHQLLEPNGKLVGLLFNKMFNTFGPPFGGFKANYEPMFAPYFKFNTFEACYNSLPPRATNGGELFINFTKI